MKKEEREKKEKERERERMEYLLLWGVFLIWVGLHDFLS